MQRYFFDIVHQSRSEIDFNGREFKSPEAALSLAELIALDESMSGERLGWKVSVFNVVGKQLFSIPILANPELMAA